MALQPPLDTPEAPRQAILIDKEPLATAASPARSKETIDLHQADAERTLAPSGASSPRLTKEVSYEDDDEYPDGGIRAWMMVLGATCTTCATFGVTNSWGVFQSLYEGERLRDTPPSTIAWIGSMQYALVFFPGLLTGRLFDTGVFRVPMFCWSLVLVVSCLLIAECKVYWHYLVVQGLMLGLACGCLFGPALSVVAHWFKRRRSLAFGILAVGSSIGGTVFPIMVRRLEASIGFAWSLRVLALVEMCLLAIANVTLRRRLPAAPTPGGIFNLSAFRMPAYSIYVSSTFFCFFGLYAVLTYIDTAAPALSHGAVSPEFSFYLVAIANAGAGIGRLIVGIIGDRVGAVNTMVPSALIAAAMTFAWPFAGRTLVGTIVLGVAYGASSGAYGALIVVPVAHMGDHRDVGRRTGMQGTILALGALAGPPTCGAIATASGSYVNLGVFAGTMIIFAACLMMTSKKIYTGSWIYSKF